MSLLEIKGLETEFQTEQGVVKALRGINYTVDRGEASLDSQGERDAENEALIPFSSFCLLSA